MSGQLVIIMFILLVLVNYLKIHNLSKNIKGKTQLQESLVQHETCTDIHLCTLFTQMTKRVKSAHFYFETSHKTLDS